MEEKCDICGDYAKEECSYVKEGYKNHRCQDCYNLEQKIAEIRERRLRKKKDRKDVLKLKKMNRNIKRVKVKDLETSTTKYKHRKVVYIWNDIPEGILSQIPEEYHNNDVYIVKNNCEKEAYSEVIKLMNERYVFKQLGLKLQATDRSEVYYSIRKIMNNKLDIAGDSKKQRKGIGEKVPYYCKRLYEHLGYEYWGYVYDYLNIKPKETIIIYDTEMNTDILSNKSLKDYAETPFFLIICEKEEPLRATMEEMINRGYTKGFYGVVLGGTSTTYNIKLLIDLSKIRNFYAFIMTDLDIGGILILMDMKRWFPCESIGINPEMLAFAGVGFEEGCEDYKQKSIDFEGKKGIFNRYNIDEEQRERYRDWIDMCIKRRFEINSLTALRLKQDFNISKARDFCDYLISKIEDPDRAWNLNRYDKPTYTKPILYDIDIYKPQFIQDVEKEIDKKIKDINDELEKLINKIAEKQKEIEKSAYKELNEYLESKEMKDDDDWEKLIEDKVNKMYQNNRIIHKLLYMRSKSVHKKIQRKNRKYKGEKIVKEPENIITNQTKQLKTLTAKQTEALLEMVKKQDIICKRIIRVTPEYREIKKMLTRNKEQFTETSFLDNVADLQEELTEMFEELTETINHDTNDRSLTEGD